MASSFDRNGKFSERIFQLLQYSEGPSFSAHKAAMMTKTDLTFLAFFFFQVLEIS